MKVLLFQRPAPRRPTSVERALYGDELAQRDRLRARRAVERQRPGYLRRPLLALTHGSAEGSEPA